MITFGKLYPLEISTQPFWISVGNTEITWHPSEVLSQKFNFVFFSIFPAASTHGDKDQEERNKAVQEFRSKTKDVLVATDVASKGLDFPEIKHVINYDMPEEIGNY